MIPVIADLFELDFKDLQIKYLEARITDEFSKEPFFEEALHALSNNNIK